MPHYTNSKSSKMASISTQPNNYFLNFPPPSPFHPFNPPPPPSRFNPQPSPPPPFATPPPPPPPPRQVTPPPPKVRPPPPPRPIHPPSPPPPRPVRPPPFTPMPAPLPPSPSPNNHTIVIVVVVSLGGLFLLSMLAFALFCCIKSRKKKTQESEVIHFDEHKTVKETIVPGPFGQNTVVITVEDDVHIDEEIKKKSEKGGHGLHAKSSSPEADDQGTTSSSNVEVATATPPAPDHHVNQKTNSD